MQRGMAMDDIDCLEQVFIGLLGVPDVKPERKPLPIGPRRARHRHRRFIRLTPSERRAVAVRVALLTSLVWCVLVLGIIW